MKSMSPTGADGKIFHYHDLVIEVPAEVYDPAEDSFLLLEHMHITSGDKVLELGTGCGLIALSCAQRGAHVVCTDINPFAVEAARLNIERNRHLLKGPVEVRAGDLFSVLDTAERFDVIVFNPPYLPTSTKDRVGGWLDVATDGGHDGLAVTTRFLKGLKRHLAFDGSAYLMFSSLTSKQRFEASLKSAGFSNKVVARQLFETEELEVYCLTPTG